MENWKKWCGRIFFVLTLAFVITLGDDLVGFFPDDVLIPGEVGGIGVSGIAYLVLRRKLVQKLGEEVMGIMEGRGHKELQPANHIER